MQEVTAGADIDGDELVDETGVEQKDIDLIMNQVRAGCEADEIQWCASVVRHSAAEVGRKYGYFCTLSFASANGASLSLPRRGVCGSSQKMDTCVTYWHTYKTLSWPCKSSNRRFVEQPQPILWPAPYVIACVVLCTGTAVTPLAQYSSCRKVHAYKCLDTLKD